MAKQFKTQDNSFSPGLASQGVQGQWWWSWKFHPKGPYRTHPTNCCAWNTKIQYHNLIIFFRYIKVFDSRKCLLTTCQQCEAQTRGWGCRSACRRRRRPPTSSWWRWRSCTRPSPSPPSSSCTPAFVSCDRPQGQPSAKNIFQWLKDLSKCFTLFGRSLQSEPGSVGIRLTLSCCRGFKGFVMCSVNLVAFWRKFLCRWDLGLAW